MNQLTPTFYLKSETARFYRALSMLGSNFSLMENYFTNRSRSELKRKFKIEEKTNPQLMDKMMAQQIDFDPDELMEHDGRLISLFCVFINELI